MRPWDGHKCPLETAGLKVRRINPGPEKPRGRVWPGLKSVGGDIQPQQVTVLTPATYRRYPHFTNYLEFVNARKLTLRNKPGLTR